MTMTEWEPRETTTHQHHVIAHLAGATALGYFSADDAVHFVLDIGLVWTIYADCEMGLVPESMALAELNVTADERRAIAEDARRLHRDGGDAQGLSLVTPAPPGFLVEEVELYGNDEGGCRLLVRGESSSLSVESGRGVMRVRPPE
ncbi:MAG TPA: hypothetical protein VEQ42_11215 [Pyrinomonadaceae bacterium]|nr:hypothetical protein [Pyrinomonadaceae bacterium]